MAKKKINPTLDFVPPYIPPKIEFYFYIGDKYYYRLFPIPYCYKPIDFKLLKKYLRNK